jgi:hypothetical protein
MLYISAGLQKSGTAWFFHMTNALLVATGHADTHEICSRYNLAPPHCNIGPLSLRRLAKCMRPRLQGHSFVVKTHAPPTRAFRSLMRLGQVRASYIYRDPRDAALSAFEYGRLACAKHRTGPFARLLSMEDAIHFTAQQLIFWEAWVHNPRVFVTRYEDLAANPVGVLSRLFQSWSIEVPPTIIRDVVDRHNAHQPDDEQMTRRMHVNKATTGRYRTEMSERQLRLCNELFQPYLERMGYNSQTGGV